MSSLLKTFLCGVILTCKEIFVNGGLDALGEDKQKLNAGKQTFEQIPLTFLLFTGKIHLVLCTVCWGVWSHARFIYIRLFAGQAFCASWRFVSIICRLAVYMFTTEHMCALRCPFGKAYFLQRRCAARLWKCLRSL